DFSNSSYSAVIGATIFAKYYTQVIVGNENGMGDLWWGRVSSASMLILALSAFTVLEPGMIATGFILAVIANVGVEGAVVFYNSYLPEIAPPDKQGRVSGWGFAVGYAGSIVALLAALPFTDPFRPHAIWLLV